VGGSSGIRSATWNAGSKRSRKGSRDDHRRQRPIAGSARRETLDDLLVAVRDDAHVRRRVQEIINDLAALEVDLVDRIDGAAEPYED
jgi:hypothetical protein